MATNIWTGAAGDNDYSNSANWSLGAVPVATDDVRIPSGTPAITAGLNQSAVTLNSFVVEPGYGSAIGARSTPLQIAVTANGLFQFAGEGLAFIDLGASDVDVLVDRTATPSVTGDFGLLIIGTALNDVLINAGTVRIDETSTVDTAEAREGATLYAPQGVTVNTSLAALGGTLVADIASGDTIPLITNDDGTLITNGDGIVTTVTNNRDGESELNSAGTITTINANGGTVSGLNSAVARTWTTVNKRGNAIVEYDPAVVTVTNLNSDGPASWSTPS